MNHLICLSIYLIAGWAVTRFLVNHGGNTYYYGLNYNLGFTLMWPIMIVGTIIFDSDDNKFLIKVNEFIFGAK